MWRATGAHAAVGGRSGAAGSSTMRPAPSRFSEALGAAAAERDTVKTVNRTLVAVLALLAVLGAACGGEPATETTTATDGPAPTETTGAGATEPMSTEELGLLEGDRLVVGSDIAFAPFESVQDGENVGFDIDLVKEISSRLGLGEPEFVNASFDTIFTQLAAGDFDMIASAITITEERDQTIDFSDPYFLASQALAVPEGSDIEGVGDIEGKQIAVQAGTTGFEYAQENFGDQATIVEFPTSEAAFTALRSGQVDGVFIDIPVVNEQVESGGVELAEEVDTGEEYGFGFQTDDDALTDAVNTALDEIIADGTYEEIFTEYFPNAEVPEQFQAQG